MKSLTIFVIVGLLIATMALANTLSKETDKYDAYEVTLNGNDMTRIDVKDKEGMHGYELGIEVIKIQDEKVKVK